ncbi:MAG: hypothetical protein JXA21_28520 [Anaerolineae bacterium]|nr:hypothetical protein [Anaerolineae bacterium]
MSDDLYDAFGGADDLYPGDDEEETAADEATAGEGSNRTFIIIAGVLGGLLLCAIAAFAIWAFVVYPNMNKVPAVPETLDVIPTETSTPAPTWTPTPSATATPTARPTATPTPTPVIHTPVAEGTVEGGENGGTDGDVNANVEATGTPSAIRRSPTPGTLAQSPTVTPRATRTATTSGGEQTPKSGLGEVVLVIGAVLLLGVLFTARRLRKV